jgi:hypothetical protein
MSLQALERFLFELKSDPDATARFLADRPTCAARLDIDETERDALLAADLPRLYRMGVHPLLLFPFARAVGVSVPDYRRIMTPLAGERLLKS